MRARIPSPANRTWWALGSVAFALFMIVLDTALAGAIVPSHLEGTPGDPRFLAAFLDGVSTALQVTAAIAGALAAGALVRDYRHLETTELPAESAA